MYWFFNCGLRVKKMNMKSGRYNILCYLIAISLVMLPFSVSSETSLSFLNQVPCHAMSVNGSVHVMSEHVMDSAIMKHFADGASIAQMDSCDCCGDNCSCSGMSGCGDNADHAPVFIIIGQHYEHPLELSKLIINPPVLSHINITLPAFRPPIS